MNPAKPQRRNKKQLRRTARDHRGEADAGAPDGTADSHGDDQVDDGGGGDDGDHNYGDGEGGVASAGVENDSAGRSSEMRDAAHAWHRWPLLRIGFCGLKAEG